MKKLLILLAIFITACGSQDVDARKNKTIDQELAVFMHQFFDVCKHSVYATDCWRADRDLVAVIWNQLQYPIMGVAKTTFHGTEIPYKEWRQIRIEIDPDTPNVRTTMFHEMGHAIGFDHDPRSCIMSAYLRKISDSDWAQCVEELLASPSEREALYLPADSFSLTNSHTHVCDHE